jgi:hypothetical protein
MLTTALAQRYRAEGAGTGGRYLYLLTGVRGETVTAVPWQRLAHHGGLRRLFRNC